MEQSIQSSVHSNANSKICIDKITFIYVNYFSTDDVMRSIRSLNRLSAEARIDSTVFIVDNSFTDSCIDEARKLNAFSEQISCKAFAVNYLPSDQNFGFGKACNKAAKLAATDLIVFVNCDTSFSDTKASSFISFLSVFYDPKVAIAGPKVAAENGLLHASCFSFDPISIALKPLRHVRKVGSKTTRLIPRYKSFKKRIDRITYEGMEKWSPALVDWISGCFMVTRTSFFRSAGGFDERFFMYFEDVDLCRKAHQMSKQVLFDPRVLVVHRAAHASASRRGIVRSLVFNNMSRHHIFSWIKYCIKWRRDFASKFVNVITFKIKSKSRYKSDSGYGMDFSTFTSYLEADTDGQ